MKKISLIVLIITIFILYSCTTDMFTLNIIEGDYYSDDSLRSNDENIIKIKITIKEIYKYEYQILNYKNSVCDLSTKSNERKYYYINLYFLNNSYQYNKINLRYKEKTTAFKYSENTYLFELDINKDYQILAYIKIEDLYNQIYFQIVTPKEIELSSLLVRDYKYM